MGLVSLLVTIAVGLNPAGEVLPGQLAESMQQGLMLGADIALGIEAEMVVIEVRAVLLGIKIR